MSKAADRKAAIARREAERAAKWAKQLEGAKVVRVALLALPKVRTSPGARYMTTGYATARVEVFDRNGANGPIVRFLEDCESHKVGEYMSVYVQELSK